MRGRRTKTGSIGAPAVRQSSQLAKNPHSTPNAGSLLHRNYRNPLAVKFFVIGNRSAKTLGNFFGQQVAMVAKELFLDTLPRIPISEQRMRWLVLRGEDQRHVEA